VVETDLENRFSNLYHPASRVVAGKFGGGVDAEERANAEVSVRRTSGIGTGADAGVGPPPAAGGAARSASPIAPTTDRRDMPRRGGLPTMRLTEDVAIVGGGAMTGFGLSSDLDAHIYLLDGGSDYALIDCGMGTPSGFERVLSLIRSVGVEPERVSRLLLTHYHTDHAGGAATYRERLGLRVSISAHVRQALEAPDHTMTQFEAARAAGVFPTDYAFPPCPVDDPLVNDDVRTVGRLSVRYLSTPGHCAGHGSYLVTGGERTYLFAGDAVFAQGRLFLQAIPDCDLGASAESVRRLGALDFAALLPGHGAIALDGGRDHLRAAISVLDQLRVPQNII
jgi:hydroxyacylglutathione hydrolase